jgi:hypothetical protein
MNGYECGVWTIANGTCIMLNLNMVVLMRKVVPDFRKLIFARLCIFKHLVAKGEPKIRLAAAWYRGAHNLKLRPLEEVTSLDTRPTETALPSVRSNMDFGDAKDAKAHAVQARRYRVVYAKEMKEKKKQEREAKKKKREDELATVRAEKKKEAAEKIAQQAQRVVVDKKSMRL